MATHPWETKQGIDSQDEKPRAACAIEVSDYLRWLAAQRGIEIPPGASIGPSGISHMVNGKREMLLPMPGYGASDIVIVEELDEAGNVMRSSRIGLDKRGKLPFNAAKVHQMTGLRPTKARKAPARPAQSVPEPVAVITPPPAPCPSSAPQIAPTPIVQPKEETDMTQTDLAATVAALLRRVDALERANGQPVYDRRACPARLRMIRAYLAMRAQREALRVQLAAAHARATALEDAAAGARADRDRIKAKRTRTAGRMVQMMQRIDLQRRALIASNEAYRDLVAEADGMRGQLVSLAPLVSALQGLIPAAVPAAPVPPAPRPVLFGSNGLPLAA